MLKQVQAITVTLSGNEFMLSVKTLERTLNKQMVLPFYLNDKHIFTDFTNHILTVSMNKEPNETPASFSFQFLYNIKKPLSSLNGSGFCPVISVIYPQSESPMAK